jgi:hypothetical protein
MTTNMMISLVSIGLFSAAVILLNIILAIRAPRFEPMAKPWVGNVVTGYICMGVMTGIFVPLMIKDDAPWGAIFIILFDLLCMCMIVPYYTCRMWPADTCIIQQNFRGCRREWYYKDIVKIVRQDCEVIFWFKGTSKWLIYGHDPKADDPMLTAILERIPESQLNPDYPEPPVRPLTNAVRGGVGGYYFLWSIVYLLASPVLLMGIVGRSWIMTLIVLAVLSVWTVYIVLAVRSARRAHASEKWANIARHCWKKGSLRP